MLFRSLELPEIAIFKLKKRFYISELNLKTILSSDIALNARFIERKTKFKRLSTCPWFSYRWWYFKDSVFGQFFASWMWGLQRKRGFAVNSETFIERLFPLLLTGDRKSARSFVGETISAGWSPEDISENGFWPILESIQTLYRNDQMTSVAYHYATRLLRSLVDQVQAGYTQKPVNNKSILLFCGPSEGDDLAAQIVADLCEADGWEVKFGGGGVPADEILAETNDYKPDALCMFSSAPSDAPHIRNIIDTIKSIGASPNTQVVVGGGLFNRVEGLAEEIGADLWANSPAELKQKIVTEASRRAPEDQRTVGQAIQAKAA